MNTKLFAILAFVALCIIIVDTFLFIYQKITGITCFFSILTMLAVIGVYLMQRNKKQ